MTPADNRHYVNCLRDGYTVVVVHAETDGQCLVPVHYDPLYDRYCVEIAGVVVDQSIEAVTASLQLAMMQIRESRL